LYFWSEHATAMDGGSAANTGAFCSLAIGFRNYLTFNKTGTICLPAVVLLFRQKYPKPFALGARPSQTSVFARVFLDVRPRVGRARTRASMRSNTAPYSLRSLPHASAHS